MKLREEGKSGESGGISKPTFGELYWRRLLHGRGSREDRRGDVF